MPSGLSWLGVDGFTVSDWITDRGIGYCLLKYEMLLLEVSGLCFSRYRCHISCEQILLVEVSDAVTFWFRGAQDTVSTTADDDRTVWKSSTFQGSMLCIWVGTYLHAYLHAARYEFKKKGGPPG